MSGNPLLEHFGLPRVIPARTTPVERLSDRGPEGAEERLRAASARFAAVPYPSMQADLRHFFEQYDREREQR